MDSELIASLSAVSYDNTFGFLGFYIVKPEYRNKGYGIKIWNEALKHLPTQNIGLDDVVAQQENYKKSGFKLAYRNIRYEGKGINNKNKSADIIMLSTIPFEQLLSYDNQIFPVTRPSFLKSWIKQPENLAIGLINNKQLVGYGMVRKCRTGYKVAPLFADNMDIARILFNQMLSFVGEGAPIFLDVPELNKEAISLVNEYQMKPMFETARMYTKKPPNTPLQKVYGVTSFELG